MSAAPPSPEKPESTGSPRSVRAIDDDPTETGLPRSTARTVAIVAGLLGFLLALATPLLPVRQEAASIAWPQGDRIGSVDAPLVTYTPLEVRVTVPCPMVDRLPDGRGTLVSTVPAAAPESTTQGLVVRVTPGDGTDRRIEAVLRDRVLVSAPADDACTAITVASNAERTAAEIVGAPADRPDSVVTIDGDVRPQVVGVFTDLDGPVPADPGPETDRLSVRADLDSRFTSTPSIPKLATMIAAVVATLVSLVALHLVDRGDGRRDRRFLPARWLRVGPADLVVAATLLVWHVIGANTSDDGYILTMARVSDHAGYMANYYRWFGVPEAPFGWYYDLLVRLADVSTASVWMRLPALLAALVCWFVISREVIPRLGVGVRRAPVALWTAAFVFLAFWLPYNNGLRPEPVIALGALLTWCSMERAIATGRTLPAAVAVLVAAFSLAAGPTGVIAVAALVAGARPVVVRIVRRRARTGLLAPIAPILAAGTVVLVAVFADQTLASVLEATRVRSAVGPNVPWNEEWLRWEALSTVSPDGSVARRFGVLVMLLCLVVCIVVILRKGRIPGTATGPSRRILGIVAASLVLMSLTPTKWTHHFGVYAGLAASVAALAAVGIGAVAIRSARNRWLFVAALLGVLAFALTGSNGWWYVASYGIPWWDKSPSISGHHFANAVAVLAVLAFAVAAWHHVRAPFVADRPQPAADTADRRSRRLAGAIHGAPLTILAAFIVLFEVASLAKGALAQYPAYSIATSNARALTGDVCALADDVLVETDPNAAALAPTDGSVADALGAARSVGFTPDGVAFDLTADAESGATGSANSVDRTEPDSGATTTSTSAGTGGGRGTEGVNNSTVALPFGLDPARTPVLGSYRTGAQEPAHLVSGWYRLPAATADTPLLVVTAAGRVRTVDDDGVITPGQDVRVEFGRSDAPEAAPLGSVVPLDVGPAPSWRNLRIPVDAVPAGADTIRVVVDDTDLAPDQWVAVTPPRVPRLSTLQDVVGSDDPVLLDWSVGLAFPCQRPFDHRLGVAEVPRYRILPDRIGADSTNGWQDRIGGGPLGWTPLLLTADTLPTYLADDWRRDWGSLERYRPIDEQAVPATVSSTVIDRGGLWTPGPIRDGVPVTRR